MAGGTESGRPSAFTQLGEFRLTPHRPTIPVTVRSTDGVLHEVAPSDFAAGAGTAHVPGNERRVTVDLDGYPHHFTVPRRSEVWAGEAVSGAAHGDAVAAPFPAAVAEVHVAPGQSVAAGDTCIVIEAMKMLHTLISPVDAVVDEVTVAVGDQVASHQVLVTFDTDTEEPS